MTFKFVDKLFKLFKKYSHFLRSENQIPLVKVSDETANRTDLELSEALRPTLPENADPVAVYPAMQTRSVPDAGTAYNPAVNGVQDLSVDLDIDLSRDDQLEAYAKGMKITPKTLEKWISAGILCPDEVRAAEKLLKLIRAKAATHQPTH